VFTAGHQAGEIFVLLDAENIAPLMIPLGEIGLARTWRAVSYGGGRANRDADVHRAPSEALRAVSREGAQIRQPSQHHVYLGPPHPHRRCAARRHRHLLLGEAAEAYEVDILDQL
jgi:hypothetical protein